MKLLVSLIGICSALITAIILASLEYYMEIAIYSFTFFFIVPVGAIGAGIVASSGYYLGAKVFNEKPVGGIAFNMIAASVGTYLIINYISYYSMEYDGKEIKNLVTFWEYLKIMIQETSISLYYRGHSSGSALQIGATLGYIYAALQILGFALGGFAVYVWLLKSPYCSNCSRYMKRTAIQERYTSYSKQLLEDINTFLLLIENQFYEESLDFHAEKMGVSYGATHKHGTKIISYECNFCDTKAMEFVIYNLKDGEEREIKSYRFFYIP